MKLLTKYNRVNLVTTIVIMLITGIIYYQAISLILINQKDTDLGVEEREIQEYTRLNHHLPQTFESNDQHIAFSEVEPGSVKRQFFNTMYFKKWHEHRHRGNGVRGEYEAGRGLITAVTVDGKYYKVTIVESKVETEDLIRIIFIITITVILLLLIVLSITNRLILGRLWQPFYDVMKDLRLFNITDNTQIQSVETTIDEFTELNQVVLMMTGKARHDYTHLKTFTENASHELMTPIAVINSKLDTLIQTENFSERQSKILNDLYGAVSRLNRLNQSLLLLVKIENRLHQAEEKIDLKALIEEQLVQLDEIFQDKRLKLTSSLDNKEVYAARNLVEILLSNLIGNAIRHNHHGGQINISLTNQELAVSNTGDDTALAGEKIFTRFHKSSGSEGSGLGLTISRQICENFGFSLEYRFQTPLHIFTVKFL